jgi:glycosyltransferase involved in cell wall biosynthesis
LNQELNLSVVIVAQDEERTIGDVLSAVQPIASEIILLDSGSTDGTKEIAAQHGAQVRHQDWLGFAAQKNLAISLASRKWILSLDADEVLTPQLVQEIAELLKDEKQTQGINGFKIPRMLYIGQRAVKYGAFYPDAQLRLFRKGTGQFNDRLVHERIFVEGNERTLKNHMLHRAYRDVGQFEAALEKYARLSAQEAMRSGFSKAKLWRANQLVHPVWTFVYRYILRRGFLDGPLGLQLALSYSDYVRRKIVYLNEAHKGANCRLDRSNADR